MNTLDQLRAGELRGARRIKLSAGLESFPPELFDLADTLEILDLSGNRLSTLPDDLPRLGKLRVIFCSDNPFTELPEVLGRCPQLNMVGFKACRIRTVSAAALPPALRWLILSDNEIEALPEAIGQCAQLQKLMLAGNRLRQLPATLANCKRLELLRIAANQLEKLPAALFALPRLSWLAYAGNPFCFDWAADRPAATEDIHWNALEIGQRLGEGASGVIHRARLKDEAVAVKLFKGAVTSDGLPHCEMDACLKAGRHPNLIPLRGRLAGHPAGGDGLVMALIDPAFRNLAGPPSLESCTRDIYAADTRFTPPTALRIAHGIAAAAAHLHASGILHGDLYAHNVLHCGEGRALLGDFGAASCLPPNNPTAARALRRIEARAFGCLLEELGERSDFTASPADIRHALSSLTTACLSDHPGERPDFPEIEEALARLAEQHTA